jgi:hypothetical protein
MMKVYLGFDDTETHDSLYGNGKLVRWFQNAMPAWCDATAKFEARITRIGHVGILEIPPT